MRKAHSLTLDMIPPGGFLSKDSQLVVLIGGVLNTWHPSGVSVPSAKNAAPGDIASTPLRAWLNI